MAAKKLIVMLALPFLALAFLLSFVAGDAPRKDEGPQYEYREDTKREVALLRAGSIYLGRLDATGNFVWNSPVTPLKPNDPVLAKSAAFVINKPPKPEGPVYELRSGALIKGKLDEKGNFIPEAGSKVISFKDYRYRPGAIPIYNLPGSFVEKKAEKK